MKNFLNTAIALLLAGNASAVGDANLLFTPNLSSVGVGDLVEIVLWAAAEDDTPTEIGALDVVLIYDPTVLKLLGSDESNAGYTWFATGFLPDPDNINADIADGDAIYTALAQITLPATAPMAPGLHVTTLQFQALANSPGTTVSIAPTMGSFAVTQVLDFFTPGLDITGDISTTAEIVIGDVPTNYCGGNPAACPCANDGGPGEGCRTSTGSGAVIAATGSTSLALDDLILTVSGVPAFQFGVQYMGQGQIQFPFGDGLRCVGAAGGSLVRFPVTSSGPTGTIALGPGFMGSTVISAGSTWNFQGWFRDPTGPCGFAFNLSNAISVPVQP
ncbi:MAG: hypothetical protein ACI835_004252 [Planctomycetota bacterium]|jgi:hypothetical protein